MNTNKEKQLLIKKHSPKSPVIKNCFFAFIIGGGICTLGELILLYLVGAGVEMKIATTLVTVTLVLLAGAVTALGFFDKIVRFAGAGTLVPVTGFSNSVTSEAVDSRNEGFVLGVGSKIFTVAGPVIVYGLFSGVLYGIVYFLYTAFT